MDYPWPVPPTSALLLAEAIERITRPFTRRRLRKSGLALAIAAYVASPALAQQPPAGRELPIVCTAGTCGGVSHWVAPGADAATRAINGQQMSIRQRREKELFNWASFDIASGYGVDFDQDFGAAAVALNRVLGTTNPQSIINGRLTADGEVLVINPNGIVFGRDAQVDVHSMIASTLDVNDVERYFQNGITGAINARDAAFAGTLGALGDITIEEGASIEAGEGGRVMVMAPNVSNRGRIEAPGGQAILAGSHDRVFVAASADQNLRGLVIEVATGGTVENLGEIVAERGNVSLLGLAVNQDGLVRSTSAINFNGSIRIAARHKADAANIITLQGQSAINPTTLRTVPDAGDPQRTFGVRFGPGSVTEVIPDPADTATAFDEQPQRPGRIEVIGRTVALEAGARITAPGGIVGVTARGDSGIDGEVTLGAGASIDVSGTDTVQLPMSRNVGTIELRGPELADVPLQRDGVLRGEEVSFDLRSLRFEEGDPATAEDDEYFLPVGRVTAAVDAVRRGIEELSAAGGSVSIETDRVALETDSLIDFSGGVIAYEPGFIPATFLMSEGRVFEISQADPNLVYDALLPTVELRHSKWGVIEVFNVFGLTMAAGTFDAGYVEGKDAGSLTINATDVTLDGELRGGTSAGRLQRKPAAPLVAGRMRSFDEVPLAGALEIGFREALPDRVILTGPPAVHLGAGDAPDGALVLDPALLEPSGINRLTVFSGGRITTGDLSLAPGGRVRLESNEAIVVDGALTTPGGQVQLATEQNAILRPGLTVTERGAIDVQGSWVNDSAALNPAGATAPLFIEGGSVNLAASGDLTVAAGALIDVGGGAQLGADGTVNGGKAGAISIASVAPDGDLVETVLAVEGTFRGFALEAGGSLALTGAGFVIGGDGTPALLGGVALDAAFFSSGGFASYDLTVASLANNAAATLIEIADGTAVFVRAENLTLDPDFAAAPTGTDIDELTGVALLPEVARQATRLTLSAGRSQFETGDLPFGVRVGEGASVQVDPGGAITVTADDRIFVEGLLAAPGGTVSLLLEDAGATIGFRNQGIWLGNDARLDTAGVARIFEDAGGRRAGDVLAGGLVSLTAERGYVVAAPGSVIEASGAAGILDLPILGPSGLLTVAGTTVASAGGAIGLSASEGILPYGTVTAAAGGAGAAGGQLAISLDVGDRQNNSPFVGNVADQFPETARLVMLGERPDFDPNWLAFGAAEFTTAFASPGVDAMGVLAGGAGVNGIARVAPEDITAGGFGSLVLGARQNDSTQVGVGLVPNLAALPAEVRLAGDLDLALEREIRLDAPILSSDGGEATLAAAYVALGSRNTTFRVAGGEERNLFEPAGGRGRLTVTADLIDLVGFSTLSGFGRGGLAPGEAGAPVVLDSAGDIRLVGLPVAPRRSRVSAQFPEIGGALELATDLELRARQVYPTTFSQFTVAVRAEDGTLTIAGTDPEAPVPLSAAGAVVLSAQHVRQRGVLRAPLGQIAIDGAVRDVRAGTMQAIAHADNEGSVLVTPVVVNTADILAADYRLTYDGDDRYTLRRLSDGRITRIDTAGGANFTTATVDGFRLSLANLPTATPGDSFLIRTSKAPLQGTVTLASGSLTSVSGAGAVAPFGDLLLEDNWVFEINDTVRTLDEPRIFSDQPTADELAARPFNAADRPWVKSIDIASRTVDLQEGAEIDLSGGGDLIATEFLTGPGGSRDILRGADDSTAFAVVPTLGSHFAPLDPLLAAEPLLGSDLAPELPALPLAELQLTVTIGAGSELPPGAYAVLPRGYAVLPGAYLVTPVADTLDVPAGTSVERPDGRSIVSANFGLAGTTTSQVRAVGVIVESRDQLFERAEYDVASADEFFAGRATDRGTVPPQLPRDGGRMVIDVVDALGLGGSLAPNTGEGRSSQLDITAGTLAVVAAPSPAPAGRVELLASDLNALGAESLLIGGTRSFAEDAVVLDLRANRVTVEAGADLRVPEVLIGATGEVTVANGASVRAEDDLSAIEAISFATDAAGNPKSRALLRASAGGQVTLSGDAAPGGRVTVRAGASLYGAGSITVDGSGDVVVAGDLETGDGSIALRAGQISLGQAPGATPGLVLGALDDLRAVDLRLISASTIDLYGSIPLTDERLEHLLLDADALRGFGAGGAPADARFAADRVELRNSGTRAAPAASPVTGNLRIDATELTLGAGTYDLLGFSTVVLAAERISGDGSAALSAAGALTLATDRLGAAGGAAVALAAAGEVRIDPLLGIDSPYAATAGGLLTRSAPDGAGLGAALTVAGASVRHAGHIVLPSGSVTLAAIGAQGSVTLAAGSIIDVAGSIQRFDDLALGTLGGRVILDSAAALSIEGGARVDASGVAVVNPSGAVRGQDAGTLELRWRSVPFTAPPADALLGGLWLAGVADDPVFLNPIALRAGASAGDLESLAETLASAGAPVGAELLEALAGSYEGAAALIDARRLPGTALRGAGAALAAGGFGRLQSIRAREGDLTVVETMRARQIELSADRGSINVRGTIDASGLEAGRIELNGGTAVIVTGELRARGTAPGARGGDVALASRDGLVAILEAGLIDVSGTAGADPDGTPVEADSGNVRLTVPREGFADLVLDPMPDATPGPITLLVDGRFTAEAGALTLNGNLKGVEGLDGILLPGTLTLSAGLIEVVADELFTQALYGPGPGDPDVRLRDRDGALLLSGDLLGFSMTGVNGFDLGEMFGQLFLGGPALGSSFSAPGVLLTLALNVSQPFGADIFAGSFTGNLDGRVELMPVRTGALVEGAIEGAERVDVVVNSVYDGINHIVAGGIDSGNQIGIDGIRNDVAAVMTNAEALREELDPTAALGDRLHFLPGIEIRSPDAGDTTLALETPWDFAADGDGDRQLDWRFGGEAGVLTLRAAGDLLIAADLSDGLGKRDSLRLITGFYVPFDGGPKPAAPVDTLLLDRSWDYRLVGGADLRSATGSAASPDVASADLLAVARGAAADLILDDGARVRTGTGDIDLAAARDLVYEGRNAAVYTMGAHAGFGAIAFDELERFLVDQGEASDLENFLAFQLLFDFLVEGGIDYGPVIPRPADEVLNALGLGQDNDASLPPELAEAAAAVVEDLLGAPYFFDSFVPGAGFGEGGGDIRVSTGRDILGPGSDQLMTDWLVTLGGPSNDGELVTLEGRDVVRVPTLWTVVPDRFRQNLGTLGGGDVAIDAGRAINDLSVVVATTGEPVGEGFSFQPLSERLREEGVNEVRVLGGGDLRIDARGDIRGGRFFVDGGAGEVRSGGTIGATGAGQLDAVVALGDASMRLSAARDLTLETAFNFSMIRRPALNDGLGADTQSFFFTYGADDALELASLAGDLVLENANLATDPIFADLLRINPDSSEQQALRIYPGRLSAAALGGDIVIGRGVRLYPSAQGNLELLADGNVSDRGRETPQTGGEVTLVQSDADPALLPRLSNPVTASPGAGVAVAFDPAKNRPIDDAQFLWHAASPIHLGDPEPNRIVAREGSIGKALPGAFGLRLFTAEQTRVSVGRDVFNLDAEIQHASAEDSSVIRAGRDVRFEAARDLAGRLAQSGQTGIQFTGPGRGTVVAGRDIDLGTSDGIVSVGDLRNFALADTGADLAVLAGVGSEVDFVGFFDTYVRNLPDGDEEALEYMRDLLDVEGALLDEDKVAAALADLRRYREALVAAGIDPDAPRESIGFSEKLAALLLSAFFTELQSSGIGASSPREDGSAPDNDFTRGYLAAGTLFPEQDDTDGGLALLLSRIHTEDGGDISVFVPGGSANAGAADTSALTKQENQLGIVVQREGDLRGFVREDFLVNASRVFALQGGDIVLWASNGNIDAGRGAKTALAAPPPIVVVLPDGTVTTEFPPEVAGSGIRNFAPPGTAPGDVFLFAPRGVVSAGDAGIASAGNITIGAVEVVGADNIDVGGASIGVPTAEVGSIAAGLTGVSNVASAATKDAQESASERQLEDDGGGGFAEQALSFISVDVLGFGDGPAAPPGGRDQEEDEDDG
jgi:filamentous hemagglutinin family protein